MPNLPEYRAEYLAKKEAERTRLREFFSTLPEGEYVLELGCGHGHFLNALALKDRETGLRRYYLGVDKNPERIEKCQKKAQRAGFDNVYFVRAKIEDLFPLWREKMEVTEVFVLFPDPWPRARHHKHRFVNSELSEALYKITSPKAIFHYRGDHDEYTQVIRELLQTNPFWEISKESLFPVGLPSTVFEGHHPVHQTLAAFKRKLAR